jgi:tetratricopeptide (TPR) repeat protein
MSGSKSIHVTRFPTSTNLRLYEIAVRRHDTASADRLAATLENTPLEISLLDIRVHELAYYGRLREARRVNDRFIELLKRQDLSERIPIAYSALAATAAFLGDRDLARQQAKAAAALPSKHPDVHANIAFTYLYTGDTVAAQNHWATVMKLPIPDHTARALAHAVFQSRIALSAGRAEEAVKRLQSVPEGTKSALVLNALIIRGDAHYALKQYSEAERAFRAVLARESLGPFTLAPPLAAIGLARTLAASGQHAAARDEYEKVLAHWKNADPDLALVRQLKAEAEKLGS